MSMISLRRTSSIAAAACLGLVATSPSFAATVTGQVDATITLTSACEVNGANGTTGVEFGTIDFGSQTTLFSQADGELVGGAQSGISIQCSPGQDATLTFLAGINDADAGAYTRAMAGNGQFVPYNLYSDSGRQTVLDNGDELTVVADGSVQTIPVYARAFGNDGLAAGTYSDTVQVSLEF